MRAVRRRGRASPSPGVLECGRCGVDAARRPAWRATAIKMPRAPRRRRTRTRRARGAPRRAGRGDRPLRPRPMPRRRSGSSSAPRRRCTRCARADIVAFVEMDQELLASRYRAAEQALALLARAGADGRRSAPGRSHRRADAACPSTRCCVPRSTPTPRLRARTRWRVATSSASRRRRRWRRSPGASAPAFMDAFGAPLGVEVMGPADGRWLLRALDHATLCDALAATPRPAAASASRSTRSRV